MSNPKTDRQLLEETHDTVIKLHTVVLGGNGYKGLCKRVEEQSQEISKIKKYLWAVIGFLCGSGILAGGLIGLVK